MVRFFELLHQKLETDFDGQYLYSTVFIMDNATIHTGEKLATYMKWKGLAALTLPPYTPELNPIERVFHQLKKAWKYTSLHNKKLDILLGA